MQAIAYAVRVFFFRPCQNISAVFLAVGGERVLLAVINQNNFLARYRSGHGLTGVLRSYVIAATDRSRLAQNNTTEIMLLYLLTGNSHVGTFIVFIFRKK